MSARGNKFRDVAAMSYTPSVGGLPTPSAASDSVECSGESPDRRGPPSISGTAPESFMDIEQREIPGFPGYFAGADGSLWSSRYGKRGASERRRLTIFRRPEGNRYCTVNLRAERNGKSSPLYVHRLVLLAFVGPAPEGAEADHIDADTSNNAVTNLRWMTKLDNLSRRTIARGEARPEAKVTEEQVREIRALVAAGTARKVVGARFGLSRQSVDRIVNGLGWRHVA